MLKKYPFRLLTQAEYSNNTMRVMRTFLVVALMATAGWIPACAAERVDLLLVLAADISRSVDAVKFQLQRSGYAAAFSNPRVVDAIRGGPSRRIAVTFVEWSGPLSQETVIDWTVIGDEETAHQFSDRIVEAPRAFADSTSISAGIDFAITRLDQAPYEAHRRVIDVSGDGDNNAGRNVAAARDEAIAKGVTINGLVILTELPSLSYSTHTNPPGGLANYYRRNVIGGPGAFVVVAENFNSFGNAIIKKLIREIAQPVPQQRPSTQRQQKAASSPAPSTSARGGSRRLSSFPSAAGTLGADRVSAPTRRRGHPSTGQAWPRRPRQGRVMTNWPTPHLPPRSVRQTCYLAMAAMPGLLIRAQGSGPSKLRERPPASCSNSHPDHFDPAPADGHVLDGRRREFGVDQLHQQLGLEPVGQHDGLGAAVDRCLKQFERSTELLLRRGHRCVAYSSLSSLALRL